MLDDDPALDHDALSWCLRQSHVGYDKFRRQRPDFLVISPPKTGSTWLADNLRCHPQVFVPDIKEVRYFSRYFKWLDLNWYLDRFAPAAGRLKGEASPSYAILPMEKIRLLRGLMPDLKLVFLMREPLVERGPMPSITTDTRKPILPRRRPLWKRSRTTSGATTLLMTGPWPAATIWGNFDAGCPCFRVNSSTSAFSNPW